MYVARRLSMYKSSSEAALAPPPEGPGSGYLVMLDEEYEAEATCCFGLCSDPYLRGLPFPQDRRLAVEYTQGSGENSTTSRNYVHFIPAIDQPLSSNRYYVVIAEGRYKGKVSTCSTEEDKVSCCFCRCVKDVKPKEFDHRNIHQQVEVLPYIDCCNSQGYFHAKSVAPDGHPQSFLRRKGWRIRTATTPNCRLGEANGIDSSLRARTPDMIFPDDPALSSPVVVGKWFCPFLFVREESQLKEQYKNSVYYQMTLEQFWEQIYECNNHYGGGNFVTLKANFLTERPLLYGREAVRDNGPHIVDGMKWFKPVKSEGEGVGLSMVIVERMSWEQKRGGWVEGKGEVERTEDYDGTNGWNKFRCYVLVERFALRRMDGSLILTYDFKHTNKVRCTWE